MTRAGANRLGFACVLAAVTVLGLVTRVYSGPGAEWAADSLGGFFYVLFWIFLVLVLDPAASPGRVSLWVLALTCALETLQLWHPPFLEGIRATFIGHALIGNTFVWSDFVYYGLAAAVAPPLARFSGHVVQSRERGDDDQGIPL